jgi:hypothetical protein
MSTRTKIIIAVLILAVVAFFTYRWYKKNNPKPAVKAVNVVDPNSGTVTVSNIYNGLEPDLHIVGGEGVVKTPPGSMGSAFSL